LHSLCSLISCQLHLTPGTPSTSATPKIRLKGHRLPLTHAVCSSDFRWVYTAAKDGSIIKWDLNTGRKAVVVHKIRPTKQGNTKKGKRRQLPPPEDVNGHTEEILALALSDDGRYLASGGRDRRVGVWDVQGDGMKWIIGFKGHRDTISVSRVVPSQMATDHVAVTGISQKLPPALHGVL
jgi:ribosomal RNA-processing protein 9